MEGNLLPDVNDRQDAKQLTVNRCYKYFVKVVFCFVLSPLNDYMCKLMI